MQMIRAAPSRMHSSRVPETERGAGSSERHVSHREGAAEQTTKKLGEGKGRRAVGLNGAARGAR
jgi:hypothetical protein